MADRYAVQSGNWSDPSTWDGGTLPGVADTVRPNAFTVVIDQDVTVIELRNDAAGAAAAGGTFDLQDGFTLTGDISPRTSLLVYSGTGNASIVGNCSGGPLGVGFVRGIQHTGSGTLTITGMIVGGRGNGNQYSVAVWQNDGLLVVVGDVRGQSEGYGYSAIQCVGGAVQITGDLYGGNFNGFGTGELIHNSALAIGGAVSVTINGDCYGGGFADDSPGIFCTHSGATIKVTGKLVGASDNAIRFLYAGPLLIHDGDQIPGPNGVTAVQVGKLLISGSSTITHSYREDDSGNPGPSRSLFTGGVAVGHPDESDVRFAVPFGASGEFSGLLRVPSPQFVSQGVLTDDTVGTLQPSAGGLDEASLHAALDSYANKTDWHANIVAGDATEAKQDQILADIATRAAPGDEMSLPAGTLDGLATSAEVTAGVAAVIAEGGAGPWTSGSEVAAAEIASSVIDALSSLNVTLSSPFSSEDQSLTIVQRSDYTSDSLQGELRFLVAADGVSEGDLMRFGARLDGEQGIQVDGELLQIGQEFYASFPLTNSDTDRIPSACWRYEVEHVSQNGSISPVLVDQAMKILPSMSDKK